MFNFPVWSTANLSFIGSKSADEPVDEYIKDYHLACRQIVWYPAQLHSAMFGALIWCQGSCLHQGSGLQCQGSGLQHQGVVYNIREWLTTSGEMVYTTREVFISSWKWCTMFREVVYNAREVVYNVREVVYHTAQMLQLVRMLHFSGLVHFLKISRYWKCLPWFKKDDSLLI